MGSSFSARVNTSAWFFRWRGWVRGGGLALIASSTVRVSHLPLVLLIQLQGEMLSLVPEASLGFSERGCSPGETRSPGSLHSPREWIDCGSHCRAWVRKWQTGSDLVMFSVIRCHKQDVSPGKALYWTWLIQKKRKGLFRFVPLLNSPVLASND